MLFIKVFFLLPLVIATPFEERAEEIQDVIERFVELYRSGRVDIQVWEINEPSTSSANVSKTTRHHIIPADILRDSFINMLLNREHWPFMVQMLNPALENLRHHQSMIHSRDICNAQNALDVFDARLADCDVDMDNFYEALEHLLAIFYWTPFNIYYGPAPPLRAPADAGNIRDEDYDAGFDVITGMMSYILEHMFKESEISDLTVKLYILLLYAYSKPISAGEFKEISPTFDKFLENFLKDKKKINPGTPEYDEELIKIKEDDKIITLQMIWLTELEVIEACKPCQDNAQKSLTSDKNANYKCRVKKCPLYHGNKKYIHTSNLQCESITQLGEFVTQFLLQIILILILKSVTSGPLQMFKEKQNNQNDDNDDFDFNSRKWARSTNPQVVNLRKMFYATENLDYEYKKCYNSSSSGQRKTERTVKQHNTLLSNLDSSIFYCIS